MTVVCTPSSNSGHDGCMKEFMIELCCTHTVVLSCQELATTGMERKVGEGVQHLVINVRNVINCTVSKKQ